jgi:F420-non-reducing hydrogenase small subunit
MAALLRRTSKVLVAFGTCACTGGIHGLINVTSTEAIRETVFAGAPSTTNPERSMPTQRMPVRGGELTLPDLFDAVRPLDRIVEVDYYVPGCPPAVSRVCEIIDVYLSGGMPPRGAGRGASDQAQCDAGPRASSGKKIAKFERPHLVLADENRCFLEQGIVCLGPITRSGCGEQCIRGNMPCTGCYGPTPGTVDPGGAMIGVLAAMLEAKTAEGATAGFKGIADPLGTMYLFTMATSLLQRVKR